MQTVRQYGHFSVALTLSVITGHPWVSLGIVIPRGRGYTELQAMTPNSVFCTTLPSPTRTFFSLASYTLHLWSLNKHCHGKYKIDPLNMQCLYKQKLLSERPHVPAAFIPVAYLRKQVVSENQMSHVADLWQTPWARIILLPLYSPLPLLGFSSFYMYFAKTMRFIFKIKVRLGREQSWSEIVMRSHFISIVVF